MFNGFSEQICIHKHKTFIMYISRGWTALRWIDNKTNLGPCSRGLMQSGSKEDKQSREGRVGMDLSALILSIRIYPDKSTQFYPPLSGEN